MTTITLYSATKLRGEDGRQIFRCVFDVDGELRQRDIKTLRLGTATTLMLEEWEAMFAGDRHALSSMRRILANAWRDGQWSTRPVTIEPQNHTPSP